MEVPVEQGKTYQVFITSKGDKGDGIAKIKGFIVIVPGAKKGDYVEIKVTKVLEKVSFAEVVKKLEKPVRPSKFMTVDPRELESSAPIDFDDSIKDTEDFGEDLDEDD